MEPFKGKKDCFSEIPIWNPIYDMAPVKFYVVGIYIYILGVMTFMYVVETSS